VKGNSVRDVPREAESMIQQGQKSEAEELLREFVSDMPANWKPVTQAPNSIEIAYWDTKEFLSHVPHQKPSGIEKTVVWVPPSYSKAFYLLGFLAVEREDWSNALNYIDQGVAVEPDHPLLLCEKALILSRMKRHVDAYDLFMKAMDIRPWAPPQHRARAMRGAAVALVDLRRLDEAEEFLKKSLELVPNNEAAKHELRYIENLRKGGKPTGEYDLY
jgi:tetratricopeptide (TPR) repeat protein